MNSECGFIMSTQPKIKIYKTMNSSMNTEEMLRLWNVYLLKRKKE